MAKDVLEIVFFKLQEGYSREAFVSEMEPSCVFLRSCDGFLEKQLLYAEEQHQWIDLVSWASSEEARQAAAAEKSPAMLPLFAKLKEVKMHHLVHLDLDVLPLGQTNADATTLYEVLMYKLKPGIAFDEYQKSLVHAGEMMSEKAGFSGRKVYYDSETGLWAEVLSYTSREAADGLAGEVMGSPEMQRLFAMIEESSVKIWFAEEVSLVYHRS